MNASKLYLLLLFSAILTIIGIVFFILFLITFIHQNALSHTTPYSMNSDQWPSYVKGMVALEFFKLIFVIAQLIFFILAFKSPKHVLFAILSIISVSLFFICWIITIILFFTSPEYNFIDSASMNFNGTDVTLYSWDSFSEQIKIWSERNPTLYIETIGSTKDTICSSFINVTSTKNVKHSISNNMLNFNDIYGDSFILVDIQVDIKWNDEKKFQVLQDEIQKCTKSTLQATNVSRITGLDRIPDAILLTKNGKFPKKLTKKLAIIRAIFGLGFDVVTELLSMPVYNRTIKIESSFEYSFDCSQFDYQCINVTEDPKLYENGGVKPDENEDANKNEDSSGLLTKIKKILSPKSPKFINRFRLSSAFYLSKSAYTRDFDSYNNNKFKNGKLMSLIKWNNYNRVFRPIWYMGVRGNSYLFVVVRGTNSLNDWITDAVISTEQRKSLSFHKGFYCAANYIWNEICIDCALYHKKGYTIIFTGHSYGGSVAQILHRICVATTGKRNVLSITFGAAASMGKMTAAPIKNDMYSFVYCNDVVPRLMNYAAVIKKGFALGEFIMKLITLDFNYFRIKNSGTWTSNGREEIREPVGTIYHLPYWDVDRSRWGSIHKRIINIEAWFYNYNAHSIQYAIKDHNLDMYYQFLQYTDGIYRPWEL